MSFFRILFLLFILNVGCRNSSDNEPKVVIPMLDYSEYVIFENWMIWDRGDDLTVFDKTDSDEITNRFLVKYDDDGYFVFQSKLDGSGLRDSFVPYDNMHDSSKAIISEQLIEDYYSLPITRIHHRKKGDNSYLIIRNENGDTYWHFFSFDSTSPPQLLDSFDEIDSEWYINRKES